MRMDTYQSVDQRWFHPLVYPSQQGRLLSSSTTTTPLQNYPVEPMNHFIHGHQNGNNTSASSEWARAMSHHSYHDFSHQISPYHGSSLGVPDSDVSNYHTHNTGSGITRLHLPPVCPTARDSAHLNVHQNTLCPNRSAWENVTLSQHFLPQNSIGTFTSSHKHITHGASNSDNADDVSNEIRGSIEKWQHSTTKFSFSTEFSNSHFGANDIVASGLPNGMLEFYFFNYENGV